MSAFSAAIDAIFADPEMAADATWSEAGAAAPVAIRVIRKAPDVLTDYGQARIRSETVIVDVRASEVPAPRECDVIEIGGERYAVQGQPMADRERLVWTLNLRPA